MPFFFLKKKSICLKLGKKDETGSTGYHQNMKLDFSRENISEVRRKGTESLSQTLYQHSIYTTTAETLQSKLRHSNAHHEITMKII